MGIFPSDPCIRTYGLYQGMTSSHTEKNLKSFWLLATGNCLRISSSQIQRSTSISKFAIPSVCRIALPCAALVETKKLRGLLSDDPIPRYPDDPISPLHALQ
jgi:hypothetical protein